MTDQRDAMAQKAERHARHHPRDKGAPPHWLRCEFVDDHDRRCIKGSGHVDEHEFPKQP